MNGWLAIRIAVELCMNNPFPTNEITDAAELDRLTYRLCVAPDVFEGQIMHLEDSSKKALRETERAATYGLSVSE